MADLMYRLGSVLYKACSLLPYSVSNPWYLRWPQRAGPLLVLMWLFVKLCNLDFLNIKDLQTLGNSINLASSSAISVPTLFSISGVQHSENLSTEWDLQDLESDISTFRKTGSDWDLQIQNIWCPLLLLPSTSSEDLQLKHVLPYNHSTWHDVNT